MGGVVEVKVTGMIPGLGSYVQWDRRLDGRIAQAVMSIPAIKGVEIGLGFAAAGLPEAWSTMRSATPIGTSACPTMPEESKAGSPTEKIWWSELQKAHTNAV